MKEKMNMKLIVREAIRAAQVASSRNVYCWCANNKGRSGRQIHVALCAPGEVRASTFREQTGVIRDGYTGHWCGLVSVRSILKSVGL